MSRASTSTDRRRAPRPSDGDQVSYAPEEISEAAFHLALATTTTGLTSTTSGDTFTLSSLNGVIAFARVNDRHFQFFVSLSASHADILRLLGRSPAWRDSQKFVVEDGRG